MKYDLLDTFVSPPTELKLDQSFMFAGQNHSKDKKEVPSVTDLLDLLSYASEDQRILHERAIGGMTARNTM